MSVPDNTSYLINKVINSDEITNTTVLNDNSCVIRLASRSNKDFFNEKLNQPVDWTEVYSITTTTDLRPIPGTYYCIGSGHFIIVNEDSIFEYQKDWETSTLQRLNPLTVLMVRRVKQSAILHIDDYITYIRLFKN
jgi:hypothetical protein